jgi:response regulator NasT
MERGSKIAVISKDPALCRSLEILLRRGEHSPYFISDNNSGGIRTVRRLMPDILIIDDSLPGLPGFDLASLFDGSEMPVILVTKNIGAAMTNKSRRNWWFSVVSRSCGDETLSALIDNYLGMAREYRLLKKELRQLKGGEAKRKSLNIAKGIIMLSNFLSEDEAHKYLLKKSMDTGEDIETLCAKIISVCLKKER